jgi:hypothetical protein
MTTGADGIAPGLVLALLRNKSGDSGGPQTQCHGENRDQHFERTHLAIFPVFHDRRIETTHETAESHNQPAGDRSIVCGVLLLALLRHVLDLLDSEFQVNCLDTNDDGLRVP